MKTRSQGEGEEPPPGHGRDRMASMRGIRGGNFRLEMKLLEEDGGKILDPQKIRFRGSHGTGFKKIALL